MFDYFLYTVDHRLRKWSYVDVPYNSILIGEVKNERSEMCLTALGDGYIGLTIDCWTYSRLQHQVGQLMGNMGELKYEHDFTKLLRTGMKGTS